MHESNTENKQADQAMMSHSQTSLDKVKGNRKLADIYYQQVMNGGNTKAIGQTLGEDFTFTIPTHPEIYKGIAGFTDEVEGLHGAFPDVHLNVHHRWIFEDLILGLWTGTGTHIGEKPLSTPRGPLPATGRPFKIEGISWIKADGEQLKENLANEDTLKIIHDLGVKDCSILYTNAAAALVSAVQFGEQSTNSRDNNSELYSPGMILNHPLLIDQARGKAGIKSFMQRYWGAFEDVDYQMTEGKLEGNVNAYRWTFEATHKYNFFGIPATNKRLKHQGVTVCVMDALGQVEEMYVNENLIVLIGQMEA